MRIEQTVESSRGTANRQEQRREPRNAAAGEVRFSFNELGPGLGTREVKGRLMDVSASGFRAQHDCSALTAGQVVQFRFVPRTRGEARVVWTRILDGCVETGFLILP